MKKIKRWMILGALLAFCGCNHEESLLELNLYKFLYREKAPVNVQLYDSVSVLRRVPSAWQLQNYAISNMAELEYVPWKGTLFTFAFWNFLPTCRLWRSF